MEIIRAITKHLERGRELILQKAITLQEYNGWQETLYFLLKKALGGESEELARVRKLSKRTTSPLFMPESHWYTRKSCIKGQIIVVDSIIDILKKEEYNKENIAKNKEKVIEKTSVNDVSNKNKNVFIVHGHNEATIHETARYVEKIGLTPIILREQPNSGNTIIEKFIEYSNVVYSIVLLTGDDKGGSNKDKVNEYKFRARQNVILEMGFFIGKLGRKRVCVLYKDDVEIPSDYSGVIYIKLDDLGGWKLQLAQEMKNIGLDIDINKSL